MSITSYAQNFEDVMLWRALGHVERGCYVDIGAQDPIIDSVSHAFYEHQWLGLHVEPTPHYADMLRQQRPGDTVIQAAVGNGPAVLRFFEIPNTGISTADASIAAEHRERGFDVHEITVVCVTLSAVFEAFAQTEIHWLKIDVEGFEEQVLSSWEASTVRPWIVVIESTLPLTQIETHEKWEPILIGYGYSPVYFDGLNRYYISKEHPELKVAFATPPNVFDGFALNGTASATFHKVIEARYQQKMGENLVQSEQLQQSLQHEAERLHANLFSSTETHAAQEQALNQKLQALQKQHVQLQQEQVIREQALLAQAKRAKQELENILRTQVQREQAMAEKLDAVYGRAAQESVEMARGLQEQQHAVQSQHTIREQALGQQLEAEKQARRKREQTLLEQTSLAKQEVENLLRTQAQREREVLAQMLAVQQQSAREMAELTRLHAEKVHELGSQQAQREKAFTQQVHAHQQELRNLHKERVKRQQEAIQEKVDLARRHSEQEHALLRQQVDCEKTHNLQLLTQQDEFRHLQVAHSKREQALLEEHRQIRQQRNSLRDAFVQREREVLAQLQAAQKQAAQDIAELLHKQSEQEHALHRQHSEREETLTQHLQELQQLLQHQKEGWVLLEQALNDQIALLHGETQVLRETQQSQALQHGLELNNKLEERTRLLEACAALEAQLQAEMQTGHQTSEHLRQLLREARQSLEMTHTSLSWGITAPLRKLVRLFTSNKNQTLAPFSFSEPVKPELGMQVATEFPPITVNQALIEPLMPPLTQATSPIRPTIASTLAELLACHDQQFVFCAYQTLLGRTPDSEGLGYYLGRLRTGFSKIQILAQLRLSNEGKTYAANVPGLDTAIRQHQQGQYPLIGWLFKQFNGNKENRPTDQTLRSIENKIFMLSNESHLRFNQLEIALDSLHNLVVQQTQSIVVSLGISAKDNFNATPSTSNLPLEPDGLRNLSPYARDVYLQLKTVAELYSRRVN